MKAGDIVAIRGRGWLSDHIVAATGPAVAPDGRKFEVSHVGMITADSPFPQVTEALNRVKTSPWDVSVAGSMAVWVLSSKGITDDQREMVVRSMLKLSTEDYGYADILLQWANAATRSSWFTDHFYWDADKHPICSYAVARSYELGTTWTFGKPDHDATPKDIVQFCLDNPLLWSIAVG